jgi:post-segregation antitoxin (ccd killing protein)
MSTRYLKAKHLPIPRSACIHVRVTPELREQVRHRAVKAQISLSRWIEATIENELRRIEKSRALAQGRPCPEIVLEGQASQAPSE